jgi:glutamate/tyrosine decarboxylase-like PLP-dependent enzyme
VKVFSDSKALLESAARRAISYLEMLPERAVAPTAEDLARLAELDVGLQESGSEPQEVLRLLDEVVSPATMAMAGPRFFGFVIGGAQPATLAANWLAGAWDQNSALHRVTPATALLERIALDWLLELFGLPGRKPTRPSSSPSACSVWDANE